MENKTKIYDFTISSEIKKLKAIVDEIEYKLYQDDKHVTSDEINDLIAYNFKIDRIITDLQVNQLKGKINVR